ncbi:MAG: arginine--tRNA ligase [Candidatus Lokiarchaeota archaeon]|nr:arginine--tRNA ligase [Candidatus Lokiarchaeota archaeon]MBD3198440.1 arginine--tRNA ligase [Candidatus Lokiarchaeota archaeon]
MFSVDKRTIAEFMKNYISDLTVEEIKDLIEIPPSDMVYSYALPTFHLAKIEKKAPALIAQDLSKEVELPEFLNNIEAVGPYLNFKVKDFMILENIYKSKDQYGIIREILNKKKEEKLRIVVEYPAPNTNKPLHLGHIRNMLIGSSISNIFKYKKHHVFEVNLYNDRGIHICKSMLAYKLLGDNKNPDKKPDHFVGEYYVKFSELKDQDEEIIDDAQEMLKKWEEKDSEVRKLWKKLRNWAIKGFEETYKELGITFDKIYYESEYYWKGKQLIIEGLKKELFNKEEDGAIIAPLEEKFNLPNKVLLRSDGTSLYITQDIYLAFLKKNDFNYDKSIYVVGNEQKLYFKQLFAVLDMLGFEEDKYHFSYGMIYLPEGKMKSREGNVVDADDLIEEVKRLAYDEVDNRYDNLSEKEKDKRARIIGMAALKFFILKMSPKTEFVFYPKESISFEGETGPYVQYVYARIESIIRKSERKITLTINQGIFQDNTELKLIKQLNYFPEIIDTVAKNYDIHLIPQYLLTLCQVFNSFYSSCPVIQEDKELEDARLLLIRCVQIVIKQGLKLLGIETLEEM